jgi:putative transposase
MLSIRKSHSAAATGWGVQVDLQETPHHVPGDPSERFPCLVALSKGTAQDQVWGTDITYIPLQNKFFYLEAIVDLFSRQVISWKLSYSLDTEFCLEALGSGRKPEIFNSDQGCQFTSSAFAAMLQAERIKISWSGRKHCYDNFLVKAVVLSLVRGGVPACLQRWLGRRDQPRPLSVKVVP